MQPANASQIDHGGSLSKARALFPAAPEPWVDLSTGINPHAYPFSNVPATAFTRLPEPADAARLQAVCASVYGAPSHDNVVLAGGTQILLPMIYGLRAPGSVAILGPTYEEHGHAARLAGHEVRVTSDFAALQGADIAVVVNPNNPDGRVTSKADLLALSKKVGLLVVDEAFMDVAPDAETMAGEVGSRNLVVLRSFGKFYGLAGVRLGVALAQDYVAASMRERLGPWSVSGPALALGLAALADKDWQQAMRARLADEAARLHELLAMTGGLVSGGANLYRHLRLNEAQTLFQSLGGSGIYVRAFADRPDELRFGLPADENGWQRLEAALKNWAGMTRRSA